MLDLSLGKFDHVVAMDSLIHYALDDMAAAIGALAARTRGSLIFTFAPRTPLLAGMHAVGKLFPRADRAPAIQPVARVRLEPALGRHAPGHRLGRRRRVVSGFYTSEAQELVAT
jgi:magnesium-protoporphyrin O-methyltransferase